MWLVYLPTVHIKINVTLRLRDHFSPNTWDEFSDLGTLHSEQLFIIRPSKRKLWWYGFSKCHICVLFRRSFLFMFCGTLSIRFCSTAINQSVSLFLDHMLVLMPATLRTMSTLQFLCLTFRCGWFAANYVLSGRKPSAWWDRWLFNHVFWVFYEDQCVSFNVFCVSIPFAHMHVPSKHIYLFLYPNLGWEFITVVGVPPEVAVCM